LVEKEGSCGTDVVAVFKNRQVVTVFFMIKMRGRKSHLYHREKEGKDPIKVVKRD